MQRQRGWIYIDALLGMVIIAVVLAALVLAYTQATKATGAASVRTHAVYLAQQTLEELKQYDGQAAVVLPAQQQVVQDGITYTISTAWLSVGTVNAANGLETNLKPVKVSVSWLDANSGGLPQTVSMSGYYYVK